MKPATSILLTNLLFVGVLFLCGTSCEIKADKNRLSKKNILQQDTSRHNRYCWLESYEAATMLVNRIPAPEGYERVAVQKRSFGDWLRHLPLKPGNPSVKLYNGEMKFNQSAQFAVLSIDVGNEDLQQCADAVMRLKAEYHFSRKEKEKIHFKFTSGDNAEYVKWVEGYRPVIKGNTVSWVQKAPRDDSYKGFKAYLKQVFMYAGTSSLSKELLAVPLNNMQPGDVFIKGGFPGHAVIVLDMAVHKISGRKIFLLAQSYMPAQDIHILKSPNGENTPWYPLEFEGALETPEWTFARNELKRFRP
jgi:hypothetical protein